MQTLFTARLASSPTFRPDTLRVFRMHFTTAYFTRHFLFSLLKKALLAYGEKKTEVNGPPNRNRPLWRRVQNSHRKPFLFIYSSFFPLWWRVCNKALSSMPVKGRMSYLEPELYKARAFAIVHANQQVKLFQSALTRKCQAFQLQ